MTSEGSTASSHGVPRDAGTAAWLLDVAMSPTPSLFAVLRGSRYTQAVRDLGVVGDRARASRRRISTVFSPPAGRSPSAWTRRPPLPAAFPSNPGTVLGRCGADLDGAVVARDAADFEIGSAARVRCGPGGPIPCRTNGSRGGATVSPRERLSRIGPMRETNPWRGWIR